MEEFDVIGGHREWYRSLEGQGQRVPKTSYYAGRPVEPGSVLPDGRRFTNFAEFREHLLDEPDAIVRGIAQKLLVYSCGRPFTPREQTDVDFVVESARKKGFGLRSMIHAVVDSELFHQP